MMPRQAPAPARRRAAAAPIVADRRRVGVGLAVEQVLDGEQHPGQAVAAPEAVLIPDDRERLGDERPGG
jgi:hypothetical protein